MSPIVIKNQEKLPKLVLKVTLVENKSATIEIISADKKYISSRQALDGNDYKFYRSDYLDFSVWSLQTFVFNERQLRLPDYNFIDGDKSYTHEYVSTIQRKTALRLMFTSLIGWSKTMDTRNLVKTTLTDDKIIKITDNHWFIF